MLTDFTDQLYLQLEQRLETIESGLMTDAEKLATSLNEISIIVMELRTYIVQNPFQDSGQEIEFFKYIKPRFYCLYIYHTEVFNIFSSLPKNSDPLIRDYYQQELAFIDRHFKQNQYLYQYYLRNEVSNDDAFFIRGHQEVAGTDGPFKPDPEFSTGQDYAFAKFRAYEMLQDDLLRRLRLLNYGEGSTMLKLLSANRSRTWTDDKVYLVELAYGIYYMRSINDGNVEISDIIGWLEDTLNIDLGRAYRKFIDIRRRKVLSYTHYLDNMREELHRRINEGNRYKPIPFKEDTKKKG